MALINLSSKPEGPKRQRTNSASPTPEIDEKLQQTSQRSASQPESEDGTNLTNGRNGGAKKIRGAAAKNHREKELREERERSRLEAATKRKGRAERRRIEGQYTQIYILWQKLTVTQIPNPLKKPYRQ